MQLDIYRTATNYITYFEKKTGAKRDVRPLSLWYYFPEA